MDRKVEFSPVELIKIIQCLRDEQGSLGWLIRAKIADAMGTPFTKEEVYGALDVLYQSHGDPSIQGSLQKYASNPTEITAIWDYIAHLEQPIAEFLSLWDSEGKRLGTHESVNQPRVWHVAPEGYR